jgi:hypothetical protein
MNGLTLGESGGFIPFFCHSFIPIDSIILGGLRLHFIQSRLFGEITYPLSSYRLSSRICQEIYLNLAKNGYFVKQEKEQTYCTACSKYRDPTPEPPSRSDHFQISCRPFCGRNLSSLRLRRRPWRSMRWVQPHFGCYRAYQSPLPHGQEPHCHHQKIGPYVLEAE